MHVAVEEVVDESYFVNQDCTLREGDLLWRQKKAEGRVRKRIPVHLRKNSHLRCASSSGSKCPNSQSSSACAGSSTYTTVLGEIPDPQESHRKRGCTPRQKAIALRAMKPSSRRHGEHALANQFGFLKICEKPQKNTDSKVVCVVLGDAHQVETSTNTVKQQQGQTFVFRQKIKPKFGDVQTYGHHIIGGDGLPVLGRRAVMVGGVRKVEDEDASSVAQSRPNLLAQLRKKKRKAAEKTRMRKRSSACSEI